MLTLIFYPSPISPTSCWFFLKNSEMVKYVTIACPSIQLVQLVFIRDIHAKFGISNSPSSPDIWENPDGGISNFRISGQSFINKNCHNSRTSHDIDMKLGPIIKRDKRNTSTLKKFDDYTVSTNCDVIVFFSIYCKFAAIRKRDSGCLVYTIYIFINSNLLLYRT